MNNNNKTATGICNIIFFHIFHIHNSLKQWNLISDNTFHNLLKCKPCVGAKFVLRFQALITHTFLDRSILFLYRESACTSGSISRKWISFISRFGAIVSYFVRGDFFFYSPCSGNMHHPNNNIWSRKQNNNTQRKPEDTNNHEQHHKKNPPSTTINTK